MDRDREAKSMAYLRDRVLLRGLHALPLALVVVHLLEDLLLFLFLRLLLPAHLLLLADHLQLLVVGFLGLRAGLEQLNVLLEDIDHAKDPANVLFFDGEDVLLYILKSCRALVAST